MITNRSQSLILLAVLGTLASACDPCFGTISCSTEPRVSIDGQIVTAEAGRGVAGVRIDVIRTGGVPLANDSTSTVTDGEGHWHISVAADASGQTTADIVVMSSLAKYRIRDVVLRTSTVSGESTVLDRWVVYPYFPISAELRLRGTNNQILADASVDFHRTGGVELLGPGAANGVVHGATDSHGRVSLFGISRGVYSTGLGDLIGDLTVTLPSGGTATTRNVRLTAGQTYHKKEDVVVLGVGPAIHWVLVPVNRATGQVQPGVQVRFTRTSGIAVSPTTFTAVSGPGNGHVDMTWQALAEGTVVGDLEITPPAPGAPFTMHDVRFPTYDSDVDPLFGVIPVMPYLPYFFGVKVGETGLSDVLVEFRRTGGIPLQDNVVTVRSFGGAFGLHPIPLGQGDVVGDLTIHAPAPYPSFVVHNLKLSTVDGEGVVPDRLLWVWGLDLTPTGPPGTTVEVLPQAPATSWMPGLITR